MTQEPDRTPPPHEGEEKPEYQPPAVEDLDDRTAATSPGVDDDTVVYTF